MSAPLLEVKELTVRFGDAVVVDRVSFTIAPGEKFALVGESGSGKTVSSLAVLQLNQDARYEGSILLDGQDVLKKNERQMQQVRGNDVAMIFQEPMTALNPLFTIGNQIAEVLMLHEGLNARDAATRAVALLEKTGIPEPARRALSYPHELSGGQRQRAMIAMALACKPKLLIADEPTTALDVTIQVQILALLNQLQREENMAVLIISHDLNLVRHFADRVGVMEKGKLVESASVSELFANPQQPYTRKLLQSRPQRNADDVSAQAPVVLQAEKVRCTYHIKQGWFAKRAFHAVDGIDLQLRRGETIGIVGESGSGKSTLGMALLRLSAASVAGSIRLRARRFPIAAAGSCGPCGRACRWCSRILSLRSRRAVRWSRSWAKGWPCIIPGRRRSSNARPSSAHLKRWVSRRRCWNAIRMNFPAASASASPSPARWCCSRNCCCWTSRLRPWT
jgi:microcin C transport system ATP-binding protein